MFILTLVSNEAPEHAVLSPVSGNVFEKRLIEKYIQENGTDPMNGEKLSVEQLIEIKSELFFIIMYKVFFILPDRIS